MQQPSTILNSPGAIGQIWGSNTGFSAKPSQMTDPLQIPDSFRHAMEAFTARVRSGCPAVEGPRALQPGWTGTNGNRHSQPAGIVVLPNPR